NLTSLGPDPRVRTPLRGAAPCPGGKLAREGRRIASQVRRPPRLSPRVGEGRQHSRPADWADWPLLVLRRRLRTDLAAACLSPGPGRHVAPSERLNSSDECTMTQQLPI